jgi:hypothetical protein
MCRLLVVVLTATSAFVMSACGAGQPTKTVTVVATTSGAPSTASTNGSGEATAPAPHRKKRRSKASVAFRQCDANIGAKSGSTSCEFAENVFWAYWHASEAGESMFTAYSPVTEQAYDVSCTSTSLVVCRTADGAEVRFPRSAVEGYTANQADRYEVTHNTGSTYDSSGTEDSTAGGSGDSGGNCDPNYEGACLDPNSPDYDCEGGSGDGPDYTGPVQVVGDDHYGLDRDGDGYACE